MGCRRFELKGQVSRDKTHAYFWGTNVAGVQVTASVTLKPTGGGASTGGPFTYLTTAADTPVSIASRMAAPIIVAANPNLNASGGPYASNQSAGDLHVTPVGAFTVQLQCDIQPLWATVTGGNTVTYSGLVRPGSIAVVHIVLQPQPSGTKQFVDVFYTTVAGDDLHGIAAKVAQEINAPPKAGVTAAGRTTPAGTGLTITAGLGVSATIVFARVYSPMIGDKESKLR
jgi:hypothetical protein